MNHHLIAELCDADNATKYEDIQTGRDQFTVGDLLWRYEFGKALGWGD